MRIPERNSAKNCENALLRLFLFDLKYRLGFRTESAEFLIVLGVFLQPLHRLVVPLPACLLLFELPMCHREEEPLAAVAAVAQFHRFVQRFDGYFPVAGTVLGGAESRPERRGLRR